MSAARTFKRIRTASNAVAVVSLLLASELLAQSNATGSIDGYVVDAGSAPIPAVQVELRDEQTGTSRIIVTTSDGRFRFAALPVGNYRVLVRGDGFHPAERGPVRVNIGGTTSLRVLLARSEEAAELDTLTVTGARASMIEVESVESTTIITDETINRLPVLRDLESVALLAPGTTRSPVFGLVGFGGASVAENTYYFNGMNLTNLRNGLGGSTVPFEFYRELEVMTGGYGAEFGRSTGGVVNAVSKRGGDEFTFGAAAYWEPDALREDSPNVRDRNAGFLDYINFDDKNEFDVLTAHAYGSGPLIEDHLFFYALVEYTDSESYYDAGPSTPVGLPVFYVEENAADDTFWGLKLDWQINSSHLVELTAFTDASTEEEDIYEAAPPNGELQFLGRTFKERGGDHYILRYTGYYGQSLTFSMLAGQSDFENTNRGTADDVPVAIDNRENAPLQNPTPWLDFMIGRSSDQRRMFRFDGEADFVDHLVRFGLDYEENATDDLTTLSGGIYWLYLDAVPGSPYPGGVIPEEINQIVRERIFETGGGFEVENTAMYVEDYWTINDRLVLYAGIRRETFDNKNAVGETFVQMDNQWAPRLGFSWDARGDLGGKLYGTAGRYFLPMPTRVNMILSGALLVTDEWFELIDLNPDGTPIKGELLASIVNVDGSVPDVTQLLDTDLDPTYQDEFILGYEWEVAPGWLVGARGIYRDLKSAIEDVSMGRPLNEYAAENGFDDFFADPFSTFVLTNPGTDAHLLFDLDFDGEYEEVFLSAADIGMPEVKRTYKALEFYFERGWKDGWALQGSYTWSESRGNYEGWTESFVGQADGPISSAFDIQELTEGAYGRLPGDRPHTLKLFGSWDFAEHWQLGGNFLFQSGVAYGARGCHPTIGFAYSCSAFYEGDELVPRGSRGRSDDVYQFDLGLQYRLPLGYRGGLLRIRADVINVFDADTETIRIEDTDLGNGAPNLNYLLPQGFQAPRSVRLSIRLDF